MKRRILILIGIAVALLAVNAVAQSSEHITGRWSAKELNNSVIEITQSNNGIIGTIIRSDETKYIDKRVIYDVTFDPEENVYKGTIYSIARGMELKGVFSREGENLKVVGSKLFITKTFFWEPEE